MNQQLPYIMSSLQANHSLMIEQLHEFCKINTSYNNPNGLMLMRKSLMQAFQSLADSIESLSLDPITTISMEGMIQLESVGDLLFIQKRPTLKHRILLSGHMDTVYSAIDPFQTLTYLNDNCINGPGVADMKGGIIVMLHALMVFETLPMANKMGWDVVINADEEVGSLASGSFLSKIATNYAKALVYEPTLTKTGTLAKNRKGSGKLTLIATGHKSHAGRAFNEGRNAICFLAEIITAIHALNGRRQGVTINIGKISGGEALNVVPNKAVAKLDIRISQANDENWIHEQIKKITNTIKHEGCSIEIHGKFSRPVKNVTPALESFFHRVQQFGQQIGITIDWEDTGGCCDGNNLAANNLTVLDTMGVRGGSIHSDEEFILLDSLIERSALSTLILMDLAQKGEPQ